MEPAGPDRMAENNPASRRKREGANVEVKIPGVMYRPLVVYTDERGWLAEIFRQPAALIGIHHQGPIHHPGNLDFHIGSFPFAPGCRVILRHPIRASRLHDLIN